MRAIAKAGVVAAGYGAAVAVAAAVTALYVAVTEGPDRQSYGAMYAFGDSVLCLAVFAVASLPATGLWLYWLRASAWFWNVLSKLAVGAAGLSLLLLCCELARGPRAMLMLAPLWFLPSPLYIGGFGLAWLFAPAGPARRRLGQGTAVTCATVGVVVVLALWLAGHP